VFGDVRQTFLSDTEERQRRLLGYIGAVADGGIRRRYSSARKPPCDRRNAGTGPVGHRTMKIVGEAMEIGRDPSDSSSTA
jgi:hypothetical protein